MNVVIDTINLYFNGLLINPDITKTADAETGVISLEFAPEYPEVGFHGSEFSIFFIDE